MKYIGYDGGGLKLIGAVLVFEKADRSGKTIHFTNDMELFYDGIWTLTKTIKKQMSEHGK